MTSTKKIVQFLKMTPSFSHWQQLGIKHHHGICTPLFSLHSKESCGIGEFLDIIPFIDFCKQVNFNLVQLLPLNDTGLDSSPYNCISAFSLNPIYLSLLSIPGIKNNDKYANQLKFLKLSIKNKKINYISTYTIKHSILYDYYFSYILKIKKINTSFEEFKKKASFWLIPYALFKTLKITFSWKDWELWDNNTVTFDKCEKLLKKYNNEISFHCYIQYLCYKQLKTVKNYAENKNILIKGDLPILVSKESCDVWFYRNFFSLSDTAGSPPDIYNKKGQNWMFPLYNWKNIEKSNYIWWRERLKQHTQFYHIYRLDHVVGFFRIWAIQLKNYKGKFIPKNEIKARKQGNSILKMMLESTHMLPIGEDLGIVPNYVKEDMFKLGICGTKIIRWERNWDNDCSFIPYHNYPTFSLTSVSSHDSDTLYQWWKNSPKEAKEFSLFKQWKYSKILSQEKHQEILKDSHQTPSLFHVNLIQEYLALIPNLISKNSFQERINQPGIVSKNNWVYRCIPSLETLLKHKKLQKKIRNLIEK